MAREKRGPVAFVLSGGASLGAIQAGMLRALYEREIAPDMIVGTSAGALNGAFIASRPQTVETADALADIWRDLRRGEIFPLNPLTGLLGFLGSREHLVPASGLRKLIARHVGADSLEAMPIPLHVVAVDTVSGEEFRLSAGSTRDAVLASAAIPAVFPPVVFEGRELMDGGVANNAPLSHAIELGAKTVYVLPAGHACALEKPPHGALGMALHAISLLTDRRLADDIEKHRDEARLVVLPPPCPLAVQPTDFSHGGELVDRSLAGARRFLDSGGARQPPICLTHASRALRTRRKKVHALDSNQVVQRDPNPTDVGLEIDHEVGARRAAQLRGAGFSESLASQLASDCRFDLRTLIDLVKRGCPPQLAARILAPVDGEQTAASAKEASRR